MSTERAPAFQFYPRDFLSDERVRVMDVAARGAYITLLCFCWLEGSLPLDERAICRLAGSSLNEWKRIGADVMACFFERDGRYYQKRLELEREKQEVYRQKQSNAGRRSAELRLNRGSTTVPTKRQPEGNQEASLLSSSSSSSSVRTDPPTPLSAIADAGSGFEEFWSAYPKKVSKPDALKAWKQKKLTPADLPKLLASIAQWVSTAQWQDIDKVPYPATWLRGERYNDTPASGPSASVPLPRAIPPELARKLGPSYCAQDWYAYCTHEPKCETGPMHRKRLAIDEVKAQAKPGVIF